MLLSIGMMVKNESKHLEECLDSLQPILNSIDSELIIVDTGSEDNTVEIAKKYTDKVHFHKWNNNFSEMRNIVLSYCKGEWLLVIDGDEFFEDNQEIIDFFKSKIYTKYNSATIKVNNLIDYSNRSNFSTLDSLRLFKKDKELKYRGIIHNQPIWKKPVKSLNSSLIHYGYISTDKELMKKKFERTSKLLKQELEKNPNDIYYRYQLSVSYAMYGDLEEALKEVEKAYKLLNTKKKKIIYRYIFTQYTKILLANQKYSLCEKIAIEGINLLNENTSDKIDLYFYLAKSQYLLNKDESSICNYFNYLDLLKKYNENNIILDSSIINYTLKFKDSVCIDLINIFFKQKNWFKIREILNEIEDKELIVNMYSIIFITFKELNDYVGLFEYYNNKISYFYEDEIEKFFIILEKEKMKLNKEEILALEKEFSKINNDYGNLNKIRVNLNNNLEILLDLEKKIKKNEKNFYYADILYYKLKEGGNINTLLENSSYNNVNGFLNYLFEKYENFSDTLISFIKSYKIEDDFSVIKLMKIYLRYLIFIDKLQEDEFNYCIDLYIDLGIKYVRYIYSDYLLKNELVEECGSNEDKFHIYIMKALEMKDDNKKEYIRYLKKALNNDKAMYKVVKFLGDKVEEKNKIENELEKYKIEIKTNVNKLINDGFLEEAKILINEYEKTIENDIEIYSMKAVIFIIENKLKEAELLLNQALNINNNNFDLNYNLAYLYGILNEKELEIEFYKKSLINCKDIELKYEIENKIKELITI